MSVDTFPEGVQTLTAYLCVDNAAHAVINFLKAAFDAELVEMAHGPATPDGKRPVSFAKVRVGNSTLMLADDYGARYHKRTQKTVFFLYCNDAEVIHAQALRAGGVALTSPTDMGDGERRSIVMDPTGNTTWFISSRIEAVADEAEQDWEVEY